jgi:hypothetical protein
MLIVINSSVVTPSEIAKPALDGCKAFSVLT